MSTNTVECFWKVSELTCYILLRNWSPHGSYCFVKHAKYSLELLISVMFCPIKIWALQFSYLWHHLYNVVEILQFQTVLYVLNSLIVIFFIIVFNFKRLCNLILLLDKAGRSRLFVEQKTLLLFRYLYKVCKYLLRESNATIDGSEWRGGNI